MAFVLAASPAAGQPAAKKSEPQKVVIPFDFESKFDDGRYGQIVGDLIWQKLRREGRVILPEAMQDVRDWCERTGTHPNPDTPLADMARIVHDEQGGDIGIWGKLERVEGEQYDVYDLWVHVADFTTDPPTVLYQKQARTKTVSEIPHVHVAEALATVDGRARGVAALPTPAAPDPAVEERWAKAPNLVRGDFDSGAVAPAGWDPLPPHVTRVADPSSPGNRVLRFTLPEQVAATTGVLYYSEPFPVEEGATYRFQCRWRSTGSAPKVFVKCYDQVPVGAFRAAPGSAADAGLTRREVYRSQQNLKGSPNTWNVHTEDFTPKHAQHTPRLGRVMLYAYWPAGMVEWDDVVVKQIAPPPGK